MNSRFLIAVLLVPLLFCKCSSPEPNVKVKYAVEPQFKRINNVSFSLEGSVQVLADSISRNWLTGLTKRNPYITGMFEERNKEKNNDLLPWSGEFAGKYLTGAVSVYRLSPSPELRQELSDMVKRLKELQTPEGYIGPFPREYELSGKMPAGGAFSETWEAWDLYHTMIGLLEYNRIFNDPDALTVAKKIGDRLCLEFLDQPDKLILPEKTGWGRGGMEFNLSPAHSLCLLYRATGEEKYLRLAEQIVTEGFSRYGDFVNRALEGKEFFQTEYKDAARWERLHPIMGLSELYWITGKEEYRQAFAQIWHSIAASDIHNTGGFSTNEMATGNPFAEGAIETCCTVAWQALSLEMLKMTGDPAVADMLEMIEFNTAFASWDPSGRWSTYHTGMSGQLKPNTVEISFQIRPGTEELNCCSANAARGVGIMTDWALMRRGNGLVLNWYGPGKISATAGNVPVSIVQQTDYPRSGDILIKVEPERETEFALEVRIPAWSKNTKIELSGEALPDARPGRYFRLERKWKPGDTVRLHLDMSPHFAPGAYPYKSCASAYSGPLLLALQKTGEDVKVSPGNGWDSWPGLSYQSEKPGTEILAEFSGKQISMIYDLCPEGGMIRISTDNRDTEVLNLYSPKLQQLQEWQSPVLSKTAHILKVEVLDKSDTASKGKSIRIREFRTAELPVFDAAGFVLQPESPEMAVSQTFSFTVKDIQGKQFRLQDFASAGTNGRYYYTWLPFRNAD